MAIDFREFQDKAREKRVGERSARVALLAAEREAVAAEYLTGNDHWDHFLSYLQAAHKRLTTAADQVASVILHPMTVNSDFLMAQKALHAGLRAQIEILSDVMKFPAEIMTAGREARDLLAKYGEIIHDNDGPDDGAA